jgi:hypothetical protein
VAVTVPVPLTPEEETALLAQAKAQGVSVDSLLRQAVLRIISAAPQGDAEPSSAQQWEKEFGEWLDSLPSLPALSDEAISRESIYTREDEWR